METSCVSNFISIEFEYQNSQYNSDSTSQIHLLYSFYLFLIFTVDLIEIIESNNIWQFKKRFIFIMIH